MIETELAIDRTKTYYAYDVLHQYGNMSSATVLFVLKSIWDELAGAAKLVGNPEGYSQRIAGVAFGPGLTLESMVLLAQVCPSEYSVTSTNEVPDEVIDLIEL